jgi:uncharacterized protein YndB with AHSA1/START domain
VTERSVTHATFTVERSYEASPARVFAAWSDPVAKARWFGGPEEWGTGEFKLEFHIGGQEISRGGPPDGPIYSFDARYHDIVPDQRIVYAYDMYLDETRISVSLATVELKPEGAGTRLIFTEQGSFLDGHDVPSLREQGTGSLLDALAAELRREATSS